MSDKEKGLYEKFKVERTDGGSAPGEKHHGCEYFVLDLTHDKFAVPALEAYANACRQEYHPLALDIDQKVYKLKWLEGVKAKAVELGYCTLEGLSKMDWDAFWLTWGECGDFSPEDAVREDMTCS